MSLKSYFASFDVAAHERKVASGKAKRRSLAALGAVFTTKVVKPDAAGLSITILGQIKGGKNNMIITRSGRRFPKKSWEMWRNWAVASVLTQIPAGFKPYDHPVNARLTYIAGDKRRRDMPAIIDSVFHVLEKAGVVTDDTHIWFTESSRSYDKSNPRAVIEFLKAIE